MKRLRPYYFEKAKTVSDSETLTVDIDGSAPLSAIEILYQATNGATSNQGVHIHDDLDTIELSDGGDTIFNLSGIECQALNFFENKTLPPRTLTEAGGAVQKERFLIQFGRYLGDEEFHLTPDNFGNLQLKLAHSLTISATAGFATGTGKVTVVGWTFDDPPSGNRGFFMSKKIKSWTSAASGDEEVDLPRDYPLRHVLLRAFESGTAMDTTISNVKLTADNDKYVPINHSLTYLLAQAERMFGWAAVKKRLFRTDGDSVKTMLAETREAQVNAVKDLDIASYDALSVDSLTLQLLSLTATPSIAKSSTDTNIDMVVRGIAPYHTCPVLLQDFNDPNAWFDASQWSGVKLKLTQGNAGATCGVIVQQPRF